MQGATSISSSDSGENTMTLKALHVANFKAFAIAFRLLGSADSQPGTPRGA